MWMQNVLCFACFPSQTAPHALGIAEIHGEKWLLLVFFSHLRIKFHVYYSIRSPVSRHSSKSREIPVHLFNISILEISNSLKQNPGTERKPEVLKTGWSLPLGCQSAAVVHCGLL